MGVRVQAGPGVRLKGWLRWSARPLSVTVCRGHAQYLAFAPDTWFLLLTLKKWQLVFAVFVSGCPQFTPTTRACSFLGFFKSLISVLPGASQGRGSLVGCRLWGHTVRHD